MLAIVGGKLLNNRLTMWSVYCRHESQFFSVISVGVGRLKSSHPQTSIGTVFVEALHHSKLLVRASSTTINTITKPDGTSDTSDDGPPPDESILRSLPSSKRGSKSRSKDLQKSDEPKVRLTAHSLVRLMELSRQEWKLIALSAATLGVTSSITLLFPYASGQVIDLTIVAASAADGSTPSSNVMSPFVMAGGLFGLTAIAGLGVYVRSLLLAQAGNRVVARLKQRLFASILMQESAFLDKQTTGDLLSRLSADAQEVEYAVTHQAVSALRGVVMTIGSAAMLLYTSPTLAAVSVCTLPPIFVATRRIGDKLEIQQEEVQKLEGDASSLAEQALSSISSVKQFVSEGYENTRYHNAVAASHRKALETAHMQAQLEAGAFIGSQGAVLCVLGYGSSMVLDGAITAGDLTGFVIYSLLMAGNLSSLSSIYSDLVRAVAASNRVFAILDRVPEIRDVGANSDEKYITPHLEHDGGPLVNVDFNPNRKISSQVEFHVNGDATKQVDQPVSIVLDKVNFRYPSRMDVDVLKDFSLDISPGEVVALVGGSGSGKSTVASLLTRLYDVDHKDSIRINGKAVRDYELSHLRRMIGVVPQEPALFRGTIRDNIVYGEWDNASEDQIMEAARLAFVLDFVEDFPDGLDTMVGPRGSQLSGGQRQRVALARLLVKNPPVVVFDEATSALDAKSEAFVQKAMDTVLSGNHNKTVISIAHRLSTIRHADRIAVIQDGSVAQTGTFVELSSNDGPFRELMKSQLVSAGIDGNKQVQAFK